MNQPISHLLRHLLLPLLLLIGSALWVMADLHRNPSPKQFDWSDLRDPATWFLPLSFAPENKRPSTGLAGWQLNDIFCLKAEKANYCWAVGYGGAILATFDGGKTWTPQVSGTTDDIDSVVFVDSKHGWVVGNDGIIISTWNGGKSWQLQTSGTSEWLNSVAFTDGQHGWAAGWNGTILVTVDGGNNWQHQASGTDKTLYSITFVDSQYGWAVGSDGIILATTDSGKTWELQTSGSSEYLSSVAFADRENGWVVGWDGTILATVNSGKTWQPQISGTKNRLYSIVFTEGKHCWVVGDNGTLLATDDGGKMWLTHAAGTREHLTSLAFSDSNHGFILGGFVGLETTILSTWDGGKAWHRQTKGILNNLQSVHFTDSKHGWAVGDKDVLLATVDGGKIWQPQTSSANWNLEFVNFIDNEHGWVVVSGGNILATIDGGKTWQPQISGTSSHLNSLVFSDNQHGWVVGQDGTIFATDDGGKTWRGQVSGTSETLKSLTFIDREYGWVVGDNGTILATIDGGKTWLPEFSGTVADVNSVAFADMKHGWVVGFNGVILSTVDGGKTWQSQSSGTTEQLNSVIFVDSDHGWVVGWNGVVLATSDGGKTWQIQSSGTTEKLNSVTFVDSKNGWVVGASGTLISTHDAGRTWNVTNLINQEMLAKIRDTLSSAYHQWPSPAADIAILISLLLLVAQCQRISGNPQAYLSNLRGGIADSPLDHPDQDKLAYAPIAKAIARLIRNTDTSPPMAIAVTAPWGMGKSSVLRMLQHELQGHGNCVWFNAWHYRNDEQLLGALIEHIREQALPPALSLSNIIFRSKLLWLRVLLPSWRWWGLLIPTFMVCAAFLLSDTQKIQLLALLSLRPETKSVLAAQSLQDILQALWLRPFLHNAQLLAGGLLTPLIGWKFYTMLAAGLKAFSPKLQKSITASIQHVQTASWEKEAGLRFRFEREFKTLAQALGKGKLVLIIDDMDRCEPKHIETIMTTLNFLFSTSAPCYAVMALDWKYITTGLGSVYTDIAKGLGKTNEEFAELYLRKIVQLQLALPPRNVVTHMMIPTPFEQVTVAFPYRKLMPRLRKSFAACIKKSLVAINKIGRSLKTMTLSGSVVFMKASSWAMCKSIWSMSFELLSLVWQLSMGQLWQRLKSNGQGDIFLFGNLIVVVLSAGIFAMIAVSQIPEAKILDLPIVLTTEPTPLNETPEKITQRNLINKDVINKNPQTTAAERFVIDPQPNSLVDKAVVALCLLYGGWFFWLFWLFNQERDSPAFNKALQDWSGRLAPLITTSREWKRLENNARFFIMLLRACQHRNIFERLEDVFAKGKLHFLSWLNEVQTAVPPQVVLEEGLAIRLCLADLVRKGELSRNLNMFMQARAQAQELPVSPNSLGAEYDIWNGALENVDGTICDFLENLLADDNTACIKQLELWLALYAFRYQPQEKIVAQLKPETSTS